MKNQSGKMPAGTLRNEHVGTKVLLEGWVQKRRDFGDLVFIDLRDRSGLCQIVFDAKQSSDPHGETSSRPRSGADQRSAVHEGDPSVARTLVDQGKELRSEFVIRVEGSVKAREANLINAKMVTGEIEVVATRVTILSRSDTPPFTIDDETTASEDLRLKHRYLDLRRPALVQNLVLRDRITYIIRDYMHRNGFLDIETPILTKSTPEGARDYLVPSRVSKGNFYALPQSPQLFKQLLMVAGLERYYQVARCFRDEDLRSDRQPEFTQIDIEASFIDEEFVFELIEGLFAEIFPIAGIELTTPFPRMKWQEAMDRYGIDRPDTRFEVELIDLGPSVASIDFPPFKGALESGGLVKAILVKGKTSTFSRKRIDELTEYAKVFGASGLVWIKFDAELTSSMKKFLTAESIEQLKKALGAEDGDVALIVAGKKTVVWDALGNLRLRVGKEEGLVSDEKWSFLWVIDFPLLEHDGAADRYVARHHPFTSPALDAMDKLESDPGGILARAYDVVLNGLELGGGSIRINTPELQSRMFRALGIGAEEAQSRFGFLLDAFRFGAPPHGGIALGLDRIIMLMARAKSIRDVMAFPKTASGQDLMTDAPSEVSQAQLDELGLDLRKRTS